MNMYTFMLQKLKTCKDINYFIEKSLTHVGKSSLIDYL